MQTPPPKRTSLGAPLAVAFVLAATPALAQTRPYSPALPCAQVQALVASRGAVVIRTGPRTFDRFVSGDAFCQRDELADPAFERTADAAQCPIGYRCRPNSDIPRRFR